MSVNIKRLLKAEKKYFNELQEYLTNPQNEDLPNDVIEPKISEAFKEYVQALLLDEDECANFISEGGRAGETEYLKIVFDHFKSRKICEAIKSNCEAAFSHKFSVEAREMEIFRRELITYMEEQLQGESLSRQV